MAKVAAVRKIVDNISFAAIHALTYHPDYQLTPPSHTVGSAGGGGATDTMSQLRLQPQTQLKS
jgi:hypothetical protein